MPKLGDGLFGLRRGDIARHQCFHLVRAWRSCPCCPCCPCEMGWLRNWTSHAPAVKWWTPCRPLRLASDCSGLGVPEIAASMLAGSERSVHTVFACDVWRASQQWLTKMGLASLILGDMNLRVWDVKAGVIKTKLPFCMQLLPWMVYRAFWRPMPKVTFSHAVVKPTERYYYFKSC